MSIDDSSSRLPRLWAVEECGVGMVPVLCRLIPGVLISFGAKSSVMLVAVVAVDERIEASCSRSPALDTEGLSSISRTLERVCLRRKYIPPTTRPIKTIIMATEATTVMRVEGPDSSRFCKSWDRSWTFWLVRKKGSRKLELMLRILDPVVGVLVDERANYEESVLGSPIAKQ